MARAAGGSARACTTAAAIGSSPNSTASAAPGAATAPIWSVSPEKRKRANTPNSTQVAVSSAASTPVPASLRRFTRPSVFSQAANAIPSGPAAASTSSGVIAAAAAAITDAVEYHGRPSALASCR